MSVKGIIGFRGMKPSGNELALPAGSLVEAVDCVIPARDELMPRRGQKLSTYIDNDASDANSNRMKELYQWGNHLLVHYSGSAGTKLAIWKNWATAPVYAGPFSHAEPDPTVERMKFAELARALFFTTSAGLYMMAASTDSPRAAGRRPPRIHFEDPDSFSLYTRLTGNVSAAGSWFAKDKAVAYRCTCGFKDANGLVHESQASGRIVIVNPKDPPAVAIGGLVRNANVVTATVTAHKFRVGDKLSLTLTGADIGNFNPTDNVVTAVTSTTLKWSEVAANYVNVATVTITSGTKSVQLTLDVPGDAAAGDFVRAYRTDESAGEAIDPGDEHFLAYERVLTATDISNLYVTITDTTPASFLGDPLDSNDNDGKGELGQNTEPPLCRDLCSWDSCLWGLETTDRHRLRLRLIGTGSPNGLQSGDLIAINTRVFAAGTLAAPSNFTAYTEYLPTENVARTTFALAGTVSGNLGAGLGLTATQQFDGETGLGEVEVEQLVAASTLADGAGGAISALYAATSRASAWADPLPATKAVTSASTARTLTTTVTVRCVGHGFVAGQVIMLARTYSSLTDANFLLGLKTVATVVDADNFTYTESGANATLAGTSTYYAYPTTYKSDNNRQLVRFSRKGLPGAWPLVNVLDGFPTGAEGLRIKQLASGTGLLVAIKNKGFYTVTGTYPYVVRPLDDTADLVAADTLQKHAGALHALTTQGLCTIGEAGVGILGDDVEDLTRLITARILDGTVSAAVPFGVSYESDKQFQLYVPQESSTGVVTTSVYQALLLQSMLGQFTRWSVRRTCGLVWKGGDYLVLGDALTNQLRVERKTLTYVDFADAEVRIDGTWQSQTPTTTRYLRSSGSLAGVSVGDVISVDGHGVFRVVGTNNSTYLDFEPNIGDDNGPASVFLHYSPSLTWAADSRGTPGVESRWRQLQLHFKDHLFDSLTFTYKGEKAANTGNVIAEDTAFAMGTAVKRLTTLRAKVHDNFERVALQQISVTLAEAYSYFRLLGYSGSAEPITEKTGQ